MLSACSVLPVSSFCDLSLMLGWALAMQLYLIPNPFPVNNTRKTHWFTKVGFAGICASVCPRLPIWSEETYVLCLLGKFCHMTLYTHRALLPYFAYNTYWKYLSWVTTFQAKTFFKGLPKKPIFIPNHLWEEETGVYAGWNKYSSFRTFPFEISYTMSLRNSLKVIFNKEIGRCFSWELMH